ncbi:MAG: transglutaminase family protein [Anaerolineae bacterium]
MIGRRRFCLVAIVMLNLVGCAGLSPTATPILTDTPLPTETPTPSGLATPTAMATNTPRVAPIPTAMATSTSTVAPTPTNTATPTNTPTPESVSADYRLAFGIDYTHPEQYLAQGEQTQISDPSVLDLLRAEEQSLAHLGDIYRWLKSEFTAYSAGGRTIGVATVDQLLAERRLGGCHDHALVYAAVVRELGYPALMIRTDSIAWVEQFQAGEKGPHVGHVFVEVYWDGKWGLIDPTNGWYVEDRYDPVDPVIPLTGPIAGSSDEIYGFYVERKGIDTWAFGIHSPAESTQAMDDFARQLNLEIIVYPEYTFQRFAR